jgi:hypothetical protein
VDLELVRSVGESGGDLAPVGNLNVVGDEYVGFVGVVAVARKERNDQGADDEQATEVVPMGHATSWWGVVSNTESRNMCEGIVNEEKRFSVVS